MADLIFGYHVTQADYQAPQTAQDAARALAATRASRALAGGTDLIVQMRAGRVRPEMIVDLKRLPGLVGVRRDGEGFVIGAATPGAVLTSHADLAAAWPGVVEAAGLIGSTQVQGRASLGGNLCNASPAADSVPALIAARAVCTVAGPDGEREEAVERIPAGPGSLTLKPGEFVSAFKLPPRGRGASDAYLRLTPRTEMDIAVVGVGVSLTLDEDRRIVAAHVGLGAVAPVALYAEAAGAVLLGTRLEPADLARLEDAVRAVCRPITDKRGTAAYRTDVAGVLARRAALIAYRRAGDQL